MVFAHSDQPTRDPKGRVHTMCHAVPGKWCVFGCMLSAGGSFQWLRNQLGQTEILTAKKRGIDPYELLIAEAEKAKIGIEGLFFLPYLTGERCPHPDPTARGGWIGITTRTRRPEMIRSLLEGVTFGMRDAIEIMNDMKSPSAKSAHPAAERVRFLAASPGGYLQPTDRPHQRRRGPGVWRGVACRRRHRGVEQCRRGLPRDIRQTKKIPPNKKLVARYEKLYPIYRELYYDLKARFAEIAELY